MTGFYEPLSAYNVAATLLQCVEDRLTNEWAGLPALAPDNPVPARSCVIAGGIAWDDCECGQLAVAINQLYNSATFPTPISAGGDVGRPTQSRCGAPLVVVEYTVSILRCAPDTATELPPPCSELDTAARVATVDAHAVRNGATCCLGGLKKDREILDWQLNAQPMVGPAGMCQGSALTLLVGFNNVCPCETS